LGIHVDFVHFHLLRTQVVELVESSRQNQPYGLALRGLRPCLEWMRNPF
jgi:pyruvate/2-oxoglutarate/acetoin dehydrogenase E1 component